VLLPPAAGADLQVNQGLSSATVLLEENSIVTLV